MKRFLFAIIALMAVVNVKGASVTGCREAHETIFYQSVDASNNPITLSAIVYYQRKFASTDPETVSFVVLNCHPTISHNSGRPSGEDPQMGFIKYMTSENAMVICPDYLGFGPTEIEDGDDEKKTESSKRNHPYMCATLTARNVLDCYKAAIRWAKEEKKISFANNYYTINMGYSQGGATALAFQRYLETQGTDADRKLVNLRGSVCGAGPYDQQVVFDEYEKRSEISYPAYLPYAIMGLYEAFGKTTLRKLPMKDCFQERFWNETFEIDGKNKSFMELLKEQELTIDDLNDKLIEKGYNNFYSIISDEYKIAENSNKESAVRRSIKKALSFSNLIDGNWTPKAPVIFYHDSEGNDEVVPDACTIKAKNLFGEVNCTYVEALGSYGYDVGWSWYPFVGTVANTDKENYLWHSAVFGEIWEDANKYPLQNIVDGVSDILGTPTYTFDQYDHRTFGARFYAQFLAKRACLRPQAKTYSVEGQDNSLPYIAEYSAEADGTSEAKRADRITTAFPYNLPQGKPVFVQFAADVDGFYFGCDAPRYKVILNDDDEAVSYTDITNTEEDFKAGKVYLLSAVDAEENNILSMTAGVTMETVASPLSWRELNIRKTHAAEGKAYVSNFMPFAYNVPEGATAYAMTNMTETSNDEGYVLATAFEGAVPAGTGTIIEADESANIVMLEPNMNGGGTSVDKNLLRGSYSQITNDKQNYLHFGLSNFGNLGFWLYPHLDNVPAYNAYMLKPSGEAKGMAIVFGDDATGIVSINENENDNLYNVAGQRVNENAKGIIIKNGKKYLAK